MDANVAMKIVLTGDNHQQMVAAVRKAQAGLSEFLALAPNQPAPSTQLFTRQAEAFNAVSN